MRNLTFAVVTTALLLVGPIAWAVDEHHLDQKGGPAAAAPPASVKNTEQTLQQMKQNADKLRVQMDKILKTKDPAERQKLMQEHMQTLRSSMATAAGAMGGASGGGMGMGMMSGGMMDCSGMGGAGGGAANPAMSDRLNQMEKRLDMMQMMLEDMRKK